MSVRLNEGQARAVETRGEDLCVVAGAGTGKTRVLTERVVRRVTSGEPLRRLLAITFTERAAAEMKERLAHTLEREGHEDAQEQVEAACEPVPVEAGTILVAQCADLAAGEEYCGETIEVELTDGVAEATVILQRMFVRESGEIVDCAEVGRQCEIRLWGAVSGHVPLRFAAD